MAPELDLSVGAVPAIVANHNVASPWWSPLSVLAIGSCALALLSPSVLACATCGSRVSWAMAAAAGRPIKRRLTSRRRGRTPGAALPASAAGTGSTDGSGDTEGIDE